MYLNCKTFYSFCYVTYSTAGLVNAAVEHCISSLELANINCTYDHWKLVKLCRESGIKPILGVDIRNGDTHLYLLIAKNNNGLFWINSFLSEHLIAKKEFSPLSNAPLDTFVIYPLNSKAINELLPNERIGIKPYEVAILYKFEATEHYVINRPVVVQDKQHFYLHCLLRSIDNNQLPCLTTRAVLP